MSEVFQLVGEPKFKLDSRPVYYMGQGFLVAFTPIKFRMHNHDRIEYGEEGEYAICAYYFMNKSELEQNFKFEEGENFDFGDDVIGNCFEVEANLLINSTLGQVEKWLGSKLNYSESETREFNGEMFVFQRRSIIWNDYTFFFYGKDKKTKLSAFKFVFSES